MNPETKRNTLIDFLYQPTYKVWRHLFTVIAIFTTTLSQSFFVFGHYPEVATNSIYLVGIGLAILMLFIIYVNVYYLSAHFLGKQAYASYILVLLFLVVGFITVKQGLEYAVFYRLGIFKQFNMVSLLDGASNMILYAVCVASTSISTLMRQLMADRTVIDHLQRKQLHQRISKIKNSIQPQFLFATLHYASENVDTAAEKTSHVLFKLSEILRYQLYDSARSNVLLSAEVDFIRNYLQLHQHIQSNDFDFDIKTHGALHRLITPTSLSSFIEEIILHRPLPYLYITINDSATGILMDCMIASVADNAHQQMIAKLQHIYEDKISISSQQNTNLFTLRIC